MNRVRLTTAQKSAASQILLALTVSLFVVLFTREAVPKLGVLQRLELATLDFRFQVRGPRPFLTDSSRVVIVEISEESVKSLPEKFPWPRSYYARLLRNLKAAGARVIGLDLIFSGPDDYSPANDDSLRKALRETGIAVLAGKREEDQAYVRTTSAREDFGTIFYDVDSAVGLVNIRPDADGIYRLYNFYYLIDMPGGQEIAVPTFGFAVLNQYFGLPPRSTPQPHGEGFAYHNVVMPLYDPGSMLVNYYGPNRTFPHIKFHDVLDDETFTTVEEAVSGEEINTFSDSEYGYQVDGTFRDKIVLIGVTVPEYKDLFPVSVARGEQKGDNLMYGVEIHANIIESILRHDFLRKQSSVSEVILTAILTIVTFFATSLLKATKTRQQFLLELVGFIIVVTLAALLGIAAVVLFTEYNYVLTVTSAMLSIAAGYSASTIYHLVSERKQRLLIKSMFSTYVNPSVVEELIAHPEKLVLGGKREELTVMFSDIEGFTTIAQDMPPEQLVSLLNDYLSAMSEIVFRHDGTLDKYEGDAIMAFWGAPIPKKDHALCACMTALEMQETVLRINAAWRAQQKPEFYIRIGINTGEMVVGNMGSAGKFNYTVIGDSVNVASRLEGANREYKTGIMVSARTYELVQDRILGRQLDRIAVKGRSEPVTAFELIQPRDRSPGPETVAFLDLYANGLQRYYAQDWKEAHRHFRKALHLRPSDHPTQLHLKRIKAYELTPPPPGWNGVFVLMHK